MDQIKILLTFRFSGRKATDMLKLQIELTFWKISTIYAEDCRYVSEKNTRQNMGIFRQFHVMSTKGKNKPQGNVCTRFEVMRTSFPSTVDGLFYDNEIKTINPGSGGWISFCQTGTVIIIKQ